MRFLALALLLASPVFGQQFADMTIADTSITSTAVSPEAENWADNMVAVFDFEAAGDPWMNDENATGGSACDMSILTGTPTRDTGTYIEGTASGLFEDVSAENDVLKTQCSALAELTDQDITWGGWIRNGQDSFSQYFGTNSTKWMLKRDSGGNRLQCFVGAGNKLGTTDEWDSVDTWVHVACGYDFSTGEIENFFNGDATGSPTTGVTTFATSATVYMGGNQGASDEYLDEMFVYSGELLEEDVCRIASCNVDGSLCSCNGTAWVDDGRHTTLSLTCTLPTNCNEAAP